MSGLHYWNYPADILCGVPAFWNNCRGIARWRAHAGLLVTGSRHTRPGAPAPGARVLGTRRHRP
ncbi:hypothetical protein P4112_01150 [Pseudomonas aeruginosa]|nr:hypothetical protein [Pseudomonas aeruginosa]